MTIAQQIAKHFKEVYFGDNWTDVSVKNTLADISWQEATTQIHNLNTISMLVFHINYYVLPVLQVLQGEPLVASDRYCFALPSIESEADWQNLVNRVLNEAEMLIKQIEQLEETKLFENFADPKYGDYYRNLHGIIEHTYYHLGQIVLLKKFIRERKTVLPIL